MIHPKRENRDFQIIKKGDALFQTFDKKTIRYDEDEELYTLFINEAAYYEKNFAMTLARKIVI